MPSKATPVILEQQVVTNTKEDEQEEEVVGDEGNDDQHEQPEGGEDDEEKKDDDEAELDDEGLVGTAKGKSAVTANLSNNSSTLPTLPVLGMLGIVVTGTSTNDNTILTTTIGGNLDTIGAPVGLHQQPIDSTTSPPASTVKLKKKKGM